MRRDINWRLVLIITVTVVCLILIYPTARYFLAVSFTQPPTEEQARAAYFENLDRLKDKSIRLGLDLLGGVDVLLAVDLERTAQDQLADLANQLKRQFQSNDIAATLETLPKQKTLVVKLDNLKDVRGAKNILDNYGSQFTDYDENELEKGSITLVLNTEVSRRYATDAVDSALKVIRRRVDEMGLTQPSVAKQGENRIRVQLPGERDPQKVIANIIKPASLEFRLLHDQNEAEVEKLVDKEGNLLANAEIPSGYILRRGEIAHSDPATGQKTVRKNVPFLVRNRVELTGRYLVNAWVSYEQSELESPIHVNLEFDRQGAKIFRDTTTNYQGKRLAILLDDYLYSAPVIESVIPNGRCFIRGNFDSEQARDLSLVLKAGALPAQLVPEEKRAVEASLGTDSIKASVKALWVGTLLVAAFMVIYYGMAGFVALFSLALNVLIILAVLALARATLTLSGIGGILLTIGMAVDANVLIYERIREEMQAGKPLKAAVAQGFTRAFSVILDSNLTTLITALVLLQFAEGSVQGFALTMSIGLIANLYTGLTVTHALTDLWVSLKGRFSVGKLRIFGETHVDFVRLRTASLIFSAIVAVLSLIILIGAKGPYFAVDFSGGVLTDVVFTKPTSTGQVRQALIDAGLPAARVQKIAGANEYLIRQKLLDGGLPQTEEAIRSALNKAFAPAGFAIRDTKAIGNEIGQEFTRIALTAVIIAAICILIYLGFRFELIFGAGAVVAMVHDIFVTVGIITLLKREISLDVVSALLIILGYSVNDTIVIFDRIRENLRSVYGKTFGQIANLSINQSLNRTTVTGVSTLLVLVVMYSVGGKGLADFALTLIIGIIIGTYSSSFVATPIVYEYTRRKGGRLEKEKAQKRPGTSHQSDVTAKSRA